MDSWGNFLNEFVMINMYMENVIIIIIPNMVYMTITPSVTAIIIIIILNVIIIIIDQYWYEHLNYCHHHCCRHCCRSCQMWV